MTKNEKNEYKTITLYELTSLVVSLDKYPEMTTNCINEILSTYFNARKKFNKISDNPIINIENKTNLTDFLNKQREKEKNIKIKKYK